MSRSEEQAMTPERSMAIAKTCIRRASRCRNDSRKHAVLLSLAAASRFAAMREMYRNRRPELAWLADFYLG